MSIHDIPIKNITNSTSVPMKSFPHLNSPKYFTRKTFITSEQGYGIGRTSLVKSWRIVTPGITAIMKINGIKIKIKGHDGRNFDIKYIREYLSNIYPMTREENDLVIVDSTLYGTQLLAVEYYRYFPVSFLFDMIFTGELCVVFVLSSSKGKIPQRVDIEFRRY
jgi:hypothetical protein